MANGRSAAGGGAGDGGCQIPFWVGALGLYSSKSSLASPLTLLSESRSLALIDRLKEPRKRQQIFKPGHELRRVCQHVSKRRGSAVPAFLRTEAQDFGAFGTFGALGPPVGDQSLVSIGLFVRRGLEGPHRAQAERPAVVTGTN